MQINNRPQVSFNGTTAFPTTSKKAQALVKNIARFKAYENSGSGRNFTTGTFGVIIKDKKQEETLHKALKSARIPFAYKSSNRIAGFLDKMDFRKPKTEKLPVFVEGERRY